MKKNSILVLPVVLILGIIILWNFHTVRIEGPGIKIEAEKEKEEITGTKLQVEPKPEPKIEPEAYITTTFNDDWNVLQGEPKFSDNTLMLVGNDETKVDIQSSKEFLHKKLTIYAKSLRWGRDTSIGFEIWVGESHSGIIVNNKQFKIIRDNETVYAFDIPIWDLIEMKDEINKFTFDWQTDSATLSIDGKVVGTYTKSSLIPSKNMRIRLNADCNDTLEIHYWPPRIE